MDLYNPAINYQNAKCFTPSKEHLPPVIANLHQETSGFSLCNTGHGFHSTAHSAKYVVDLSLLRGAERIDDTLIKVEAGTRWRDATSAVPEGRRLVSGSFDGVGICGYLSGSGVGPDFRIVGPSSRFVESLEVIDLQGKTLMCSRQHNPDIFETALTTKGSRFVIKSAVLKTEVDKTFLCSKFTLNSDTCTSLEIVDKIKEWIALCPSYIDVASSIQTIFASGVPTLTFRSIALEENGSDLLSFLDSLELHSEVFPLKGSQLSKLHGEPEKSPGTFMDGFGIIHGSTITHLHKMVDEAVAIGKRSPFFGFEIRHCDASDLLLDDSLPSRVWKNLQFIMQHGSLSVSPVDANNRLLDALGEQTTRLLPNFSRKLDEGDNISQFFDDLMDI